ncbi:hypothetical protein CSA17_01290 [bacterium DOLJORAL78_65_58]|nr:MAG: hypothetical protein CSB20_01330 [bacterium DOLZORAL124_64_63]PIE76614.1 MAG: hypothetical protein CSA17_01290 [bacterium DOLJORAL78_65_58]
MILPWDDFALDNGSGFTAHLSAATSARFIWRLMRRFVFFLILMSILATAGGLRAEYPDRPIVIIVHAKPGGAIDLTARMVAKVARNYTTTPLVVENRYGGSGAAAMRAVMGSKPDGYQMLAFPATFISTVQVTRSKIGMDDFRFLACLIEAPEALITNRNSDVVSLEDIVRDAREKAGRQLWVGPGVGSLDHLMAVKTWDALGIQAIWMPYDGGGEAIASLLGGHGTVYVGNPEDVRGRPDLNIAAVSAQRRLELFPDVPTLPEKGYDLPAEIMWRGFAVHKDTPEPICRWLTELLRNVSNDPEWQSFVTKNSASSVFYAGDRFNSLVARDSEQSLRYLKVANIITGEPDKAARRLQQAGLISVPLILLGLFGGVRLRRGTLTGQTVIAGVSLSLASLFFFYALGFPPPTVGQSVGAGTIPIIWALVLGLFSLVQIVSGLRHPQENSRGQVGKVLIIAVLLMVFVFLLPRAGFFPATVVLLVGGIYTMGYRNHLKTALLVMGVLLFCWLVFVQTLGLPLPMPGLFN